ncbi:hypothetical protein VTI28DRAFT_3586 [Corynascus sepedonium]
MYLNMYLSDVQNIRRTNRDIAMPPAIRIRPLGDIYNCRCITSPLSLTLTKKKNLPSAPSQDSRPKFAFLDRWNRRQGKFANPWNFDRSSGCRMSMAGNLVMTKQCRAVRKSLSSTFPYMEKQNGKRLKLCHVNWAYAVSLS